MYVYMIYYKVYYMAHELWRLRSPTVGHLQAGDPRKLVIEFRGLRAGETMV